MNRTESPSRRGGATEPAAVSEWPADLIAHHAADRLLGLEPIDWLAEGLDQSKKRENAREEEAKRRKTPGGVPVLIRPTRWKSTRASTSTPLMGCSGSSFATAG